MSSVSGGAQAIAWALVVEDEPASRQWLAAVLRDTFSGIEIDTVATLSEARTRLALPAPATAPIPSAGPREIVLVDLGLPDGSGIDLIRDLAILRPAALPVVITIFDDDAHLFDAIAAGAGGYLVKDGEASILTRYLRRITSGEPPLSPSIALRILEHFRAPAPRSVSPGAPALTPRESEVLGLLGRGLRVSDAARLLGISEHTVADHVKSIYSKLSISSRAEAALEAARRGLV